QRLVAAAETGFGRALLNVGRASTPPADDPQPEGADILSVIERPPAVVEAPPPFPCRIGRHAESPQGPTSPPNVAPALESLERAPACRQGVAATSDHPADGAQAAMRDCLDLGEAFGLRNAGGLLAVTDRDLRPGTRQAMEKPGPAEPRGAAGGIG